MRRALRPNLKPPRAFRKGRGSTVTLVAVLRKDQGQWGWKRKLWRQAIAREWALKTLGRDGNYTDGRIARTPGAPRPSSKPSPDLARGLSAP